MEDDRATVKDSLSVQQITQEYPIEHRHEYETRLGMMGLTAADTATPDQDAMARAAADAHVAALKKQEQEDSR